MWDRREEMGSGWDRRELVLLRLSTLRSRSVSVPDSAARSQRQRHKARLSTESLHHSLRVINISYKDWLWPVQSHRKFKKKSQNNDIITAFLHRRESELPL